MRQSLEQILEDSRSKDARLRRSAARELCPCELKADHPEAWSRVFELTRDDDAGVRRIAFHTLTDGSPRQREADVLAALKGMYDDPDLRLRRSVRQRLARYRRSGRINHH